MYARRLGGAYIAGAQRYQLADGSVGTIVLVLAWFLLSAYAVLLGAEINAELECQTRRDTTDRTGHQRTLPTVDVERR